MTLALPCAMTLALLSAIQCLSLLCAMSRLAPRDVPPCSARCPVLLLTMLHLAVCDAFTPCTVQCLTLLCMIPSRLGLQCVSRLCYGCGLFCVLRIAYCVLAIRRIVYCTRRVLSTVLCIGCVAHFAYCVLRIGCGVHFAYAVLNIVYCVLRSVDECLRSVLAVLRIGRLFGSAYSVLRIVDTVSMLAYCIAYSVSVFRIVDP